VLVLARWAFTRRRVEACEWVTVGTPASHQSLV
jgi:hypothetical protein